LYLFPGGYHCGGGEGPFNVDLLSAIMAWVERGHAPNELIASHSANIGHDGPPAGVPYGGMTVCMQGIPLEVTNWARKDSLKCTEGEAPRK
jgi:feruloyl esterase